MPRVMLAPRDGVLGVLGVLGHLKKRDRVSRPLFNKELEDGNFDRRFLNRKRQPQVGGFLPFPWLEANFRSVVQELHILNFAGQPLEPQTV